MPRKNNARRDAPRKAPENQFDSAERRVGLGEHWRADGLPKSAYPTQRDALTAALVRRQESGVELNVYSCSVCRAWHMGNPRGEGATRGRR